MDSQVPYGREDDEWNDDEDRSQGPFLREPGEDESPEDQEEGSATRENESNDERHPIDQP